MSYTGRDYYSIQEELKRYLQEKFPEDWQDFYLHNAGNIILNAFVWLIDNLNIYLDKQALETYLYTAKEKRNLWNLSWLVGYQPKVNSPAVGILKLKGQDGTIRKDTVLDFGVKVRLLEDLNIVGGEGQAHASQEEIITFSGALSFDKKLIFEQCSDVVSVRLGQVELARIDHPVFERGYIFYKLWDGRGVVYIPHGNQGDNVEVVYTKTLGSQGNVERRGWIEINGKRYEYYLKLDGGVDFEDIEQLKLNASRHFFSQKRLVSVKDYERFVLSLPGVKRCKAVDVYMQGNIRYLEVQVIIDGGNPTQVEEEIRKYKVADTFVVVKEARKKLVDISLVVYGTRDVQSVEREVRSFFDKLAIGQNFILDDLVSYVAGKLKIGVQVIEPYERVIPADYDEVIEIRNLWVNLP